MANDHLQARACKTMNNTQPACPILGAYERRERAWAEYEALPLSEPPEQKALEEKYQADIDAAEEVIRKEVATNLRGVEIQLWVGLSYTPDAGDRGISTLVEKEDLAGLYAHEEHFEYSGRMLLAALRSLKSMGTN